MLDILLRLVVEMGPVAEWVITAIVVIIGVFVALFATATIAVLFSADSNQTAMRYKVFRDLLRLFHRKRR
ncbi:hypothetical protein ACQEU3_14975 [Spirillospora sp. CA-253888]